MESALEVVGGYIHILTVSNNKFLRCLKVNKSKYMHFFSTNKFWDKAGCV